MPPLRHFARHARRLMAYALLHAASLFSDALPHAACTRIRHAIRQRHAMPLSLPERLRRFAARHFQAAMTLRRHGAQRQPNPLFASDKPAFCLAQQHARREDARCRYAAHAATPMRAAPYYFIYAYFSFRRLFAYSPPCQFL